MRRRIGKGWLHWEKGRYLLDAGTQEGAALRGVNLFSQGRVRKLRFDASSWLYPSSADTRMAHGKQGTPPVRAEYLCVSASQRGTHLERFKNNVNPSGQFPDHVAGALQSARLSNR